MLNARDITSALFLLVLVSLLGSAGPASAATWPDGPPPGPLPGTTYYTFNGFDFAEEAFPIQVVFLGDPPANLDVEPVEEALRNSIRAWSSVSCSFASLQYAGRRASVDELADGEIPVHFARPEETTCLVDGVLGWTSLNCNDRFPDKTIFLNIGEYDWSIEPRPFQPAYTEPGGRDEHRIVADVESVVTHELGHVLGLSHPGDEHATATMSATFKPDGSQRTLGVDDKLGLCNLYELPGTPDECAEASDCRAEETCALFEGIALCEEPRRGPGAECGLDNFVCRDECLLPIDRTQQGYCTTDCSADEPCPKGFICVEGIMRDGEQHCERVASGKEEPTCHTTASGSSGPASALSLATACAALAARRRRLSLRRTSSSR